MRLLVVGSIALDTITTPFGTINEGLGGSATYFSLAARHLTDINLVAVIGDDFPQEYVTLFQGKGIDIEGLQRSPGKTFRWTGEYGFDLNEARTIDTQLNVFQDFTPQLPEAYRNSDCVFLANIDPDLQRKVLEQVDSPTIVACDTMNYWIRHKPQSLKKTIERVDIVIINESEVRQLTAEPNLVKASRTILSWGPTILIIKRGEYGVLMFSDHSVFSAPAYPLEEMFDPTGAGDSFAGGFMGFLANVGTVDETNVRRGIVMGSVMASFCVEAFTPRRLIDLNPQEIRNRYGEFKQLTCFEDLSEII
ncbi:MAG: PfkB family carbohydrate kinase [bacterium]